MGSVNLAVAAGGLALLSFAGAPWWSLLGSVALYALARRSSTVALAAWVPAAAFAQVDTLVSLQALAALAGMALCAAAARPGATPQVGLPVGAGLGLVAIYLLGPAAPTVVVTDLATGVEVVVIAAGGLVGYALLARATQEPT